MRARARRTGTPCLIAQTLDVLGDRWTLLILRDLMAGLDRYSDIIESCGGMSPNVLSDRLKMLEAEGLVERIYERGLPPRVEYKLTEKGWAVRPVLLALVEWGMQYTDRFTKESVGDTVPTDFAVRVIPTFAFQPEHANGLTATMVLELDDCEGCKAWTFEIADGRLRPSRKVGGKPRHPPQDHHRRLLPLLPRRGPALRLRRAGRPRRPRRRHPGLLRVGGLGVPRRRVAPLVTQPDELKRLRQ